MVEHPAINLKIKLKEFSDSFPEDPYKIENYDLITLFVVSRNQKF